MIVSFENLFFYIHIFQDILHTIFSKQGHVLRIVIFRKSGLQAMVEYPLIFYNVCANKEEKSQAVQCSILIIQIQAVAVVFCMKVAKKNLLSSFINDCIQL